MRKSSNLNSFKIEKSEKEKLLSIWEDFYNELRENKGQNYSDTIFIIVNFMILYRETSSEFVKSDKNDIELDILVEEVWKNLLLKDIKINLYEDILNYYNKGVKRHGLDSYIKKILEEVVISDSLNEDFIRYIYEKIYSSKGGKVTISDNLVELVKKLLEDREIKSIYDPAIAQGNLALEIAKEHSKSILEGQDVSELSVNTLKIILILSGREKDARNIYVGNTITNPKNIEGEGLKTFDCIVSNPPLSGEWGADRVKENDRFKRFFRGIPPRNYPSYAYITHIIESLNKEGIAIVLVPQGVLFRDGSEKYIRRAIIEEGIIDTVIYLPSNMMNGTTIPYNIMIFKKEKKDRDIFIIDVSKFGLNRNGKNILDNNLLDEIFSIYELKMIIKGMSNRVSYETLKENYFNLYNTRYIERVETESFCRFEEVKGEVLRLKEELSEIIRELDSLLDS